ncbi:MAG: hypothetical protein IPK12_20270 [Gemmatimonadetes bacterium]|nr:hypothetical protein [Gemmatimonadota bacterium]
MRRVPVVDSTGLAALRDVVLRRRREGTLVILAEVHSQPVVALTNSEFHEERGRTSHPGRGARASPRVSVPSPVGAHAQPQLPDPTSERAAGRMGHHEKGRRRSLPAALLPLTPAGRAVGQASSPRRSGRLGGGGVPRRAPEAAAGLDIGGHAVWQKRRATAARAGGMAVSSPRAS